MTNRSLFPAAVVLAALATPVAVHAQFSESYNFLKAVKDRDGAKVTEFLNKPGSGAVIVNTRDGSTGETALHIVTAGRDSLWLGFLLQRGANPDMRDGKGNTALLIATQLGWTDGIQTLLARRAGVDVANGSGETPLIRAVQNRDLASVRILLAAGANPNKPDNAAGLSAKAYAARDPRSAMILKEIMEAKPVVAKPVQGPR
ncbi:ankyrin repeat domain-containing protein [Sphingomonas sp. SUN039]|uniref:ankyrin repeat domain-containing protein n=1 Tax=Sphingomonas sp. SUN039 TaxID=2937787 RepID=UPI002164EADD|nr:ankyrin repeat domain-containing protein [Sphingomonas sp. SUN039]UVO55183.1 ankyrin repeat domain-containing protein [Sphingomonas sp. SUN039]